MAITLTQFHGTRGGGIVSEEPLTLHEVIHAWHHGVFHGGSSMSHHHDACDTCLKVLCRCKDTPVQPQPGPGALTREQLEASCREYERLLEHKRATIEQQAQELAERERKLVGLCHAQGTGLIEIHGIKQQLSAAQARCRDMEREIETLTTCGCEGCDDNLEESAFCFPCMNKVQQQVTQLQATLAAREARVRELEDQMNAKRYFTNEAL